MTSVILGKDAPKPLLCIGCGTHFRARERKEAGIEIFRAPERIHFVFSTWTCAGRTEGLAHN